jgi:hypothetical protein
MSAAARPTADELAAHRADTLDWVNRMRAALALSALEDLPAGQRKSCLHCVLARAFSTDSHQAVAGYWAQGTRGTVKVPAGADVRGRARSQDLALPQTVAQFAFLFDQGCYPDLVSR